MPAAGLTLTDQAPATSPPAARLDGETTPAGLWTDLATVLEAPARDGVRRLLAADGPTPHSARADTLLAAGVGVPAGATDEDVEATAWGLATVFAGFDRAPDTAAYQAACRLLGAYGQGTTTVLGRALPLDAVTEGPLTLVTAAPTTPTIAIRLRDSWFDRRADQRRATCRLLADLARVVDLRLLATGRQQRTLARLHRADLPGSVSEQCSTHRVGRGPLTDRVEAAQTRLDPEGRPVALLRAIAAEPGETLPYHALYAESPTSNSRVRQCIERLHTLGLVDVFGTRRAKQVELLRAGRAYLDALAAEEARQQTLDDIAEAASVALATPESSTHRQCYPGKHGEGGEAGRREGGSDGAATDRANGPGPYRTRWASRPAHTAAVATAHRGALTLVETADTAAWVAEPDHVRYVSVDADRDEAYVAVRAVGALQLVVSTALALASPRLLDAALPPRRLRAVLREVSPRVLRDAGCIGCLSAEAVADPASLRDGLVAWGEEIARLTRALRTGEYDEDRATLRGEIMRSAHGLAGSVVHLLSAANIHVVREVRIPPGLSRDTLEELAEAVAFSCAIQSSYGAFAAYRQLYEVRPFKRETALSPTVDAADPRGELLGGVVLRGRDVTRLSEPLAVALTRPTGGEVHEEAPEFAVPVPIRQAGRAAVATAARRTLSRRALRPTRQAVSVLHAVVDSPYAVAEALHQLGEETRRPEREIRPDELRYALATLEPSRLLPDLPPSLGRLASALLRAERPLTQSEWASAAAVSTRTARTYRETLAALGLLEATAGAGGAVLVRATLPLRPREERPEPSQRWPAVLTGACRLADTVSDVLAALLSPAAYADPDGRIYEALCFPPDPWCLAEDPALHGWVEAAARLVDASSDTRAPPSTEGTVTFGVEPAQQALARARA